MDLPIQAILIVILTASAIYDLRYNKIPNVFTFTAILTGLIFHTWHFGFQGFFSSLGGTFLGMAMLIVFYLTGKMGAGDVKLMGAVGSFLGPAGVFNAFLFTAIVGGIYAIILLLYKGRFADSMNRMWQALKLSVLTRSPVTPEQEKSGPVLCYGIAIAIGTSLSMVF